MRSALTVVAVVAIHPAYAQAPADPPRPLDVPDASAIAADRITIGLAGGIGPRYEGSDDYRFRPGGLLQGKVSGFEFAARGTNLFVDLVREAPRARTDVSFGPVLQLRLNRNSVSSIRDPQVRALGSIKPAFEVGGYAGIGRSGVLHSFDKLSADISYTADVSGVNRSWVLTPSISYTTPMSRKTLAIVSVSAERIGRGFGQTYFGVTPTGSAASGLATYTIDRAGWKSAGGNIVLAHALGPNPLKGWSVFAVGGYSELLGRYRRSPIVQVGSPGQAFGFAGVAYTF